jgi:zinc transport system substrate-binding protein
MRIPRAVALTMLATMLSVIACGSTDKPAKPASMGTAATASPAGGPRVVASTSWVGALAKAAGASTIAVIAPANIQHPPDFEPTPSDLIKVAGADYILYAAFDGFAAKLKDAAGGQGRLVQVDLENTPEKIRAEVTRLGTLFGTSTAAMGWLSTFDTEYTALSNKVKAVVPAPPPTAVAHLFMAYWGGFAGLPVVATYGPQPVSPGQLADLSAKKPALVLANAHLPGANPDIPGATTVNIVNYPKADLDLLGVFRTNTDSLIAALTRR